MKVLVGYDGSEAAKHALGLATEHAKTFGAQVIVAKSIDEAKDLKYPDIERAEQELAREIRRKINGYGIPYKTHLLVSSLSSGENIVRYAESTKVDEIIIGVRRRSKVQKLLFGSTAQYVILKSPCPVVTIK